MAKTTTPECGKANASASNWSSFLAALRDYISNNSSKWSVKNDGIDGSGNDGITLTPADAAENFDANLRYDDGSGEPYLALDPSEGISDPNDPTGTGSGKVSNETYPHGPSSPSFSTNMLIAEWDDALGVIFKDTGESYTPCFWLLGKTIEPAFANDPARGMDGLALCGEKLSPDVYYWTHDKSNNRTNAEVNTPDGFKRYASSAGWGNNTPDAWNNSDSPHFRPVHLSRRITSNPTWVGVQRYIYPYHTPGGGGGLHVRSTGSGDGFLHLSKDGNDYPWVIAWDPSVATV